MHPTFHCEYIDPIGPGLPEPFAIRLDEWNVVRIDHKVVYPYLLGGRDSLYLGTSLRIQLRWEAPSKTESELLFRMCAAIRSGAEVRVRISGTEDEQRLAFPYINPITTKPYPPSQRGLPVDIEDTETGETSGEVFEQSPVEITLVTRPALGAGYGVGINY